MKKIVYVEINEEITSVFDRVQKTKADQVYLIVPTKAMLFQSIINLSILKSKLADLKKTLFLVTTDPTGQHLAKRVGIETYERIEVQKQLPKETSPQTKNQPIQARRNEIIRDIPKRFSEKKVTLKELIHDLRSNSIDRKDADENDYFFIRPSRKFLFLMVLFSVGLFGLISYLALSGATIYVKPKFDAITHTANIILADTKKNQRLLREYNKNVAGSEVISTVITQTKLFGTISKEFEGTNARGVVKIINASDQEWTFKQGTRFETQEGLIFKAQNYLIIPPATVDAVKNEKKNAEVLVPVVAAEIDIYNTPIGDRGNIAPTTFFLPGLSRSNRKLVWAVSTQPMKGGVTKYKKIVKKEDIEAAKKQMEDDLLLMAREDLQNHIKDQNKLNNTQLVLLNDPRYLKVELTEMRLPDDLEGSYRDKFEILAKISVQGIAFDFDKLFTLLGQELKTRAHPEKVIKIDSLNPDSVQYAVIDSDPISGQIKITATIRGIEEFIIDQENPAGLRLGQKIKEKTTGLSISEAENVISNLPEVERVKISTWPPWIKKIPPLTDNISIEGME